MVINFAKERVKSKKIASERDKIKKRSIGLENNLFNEKVLINNLQNKIKTAEKDLGVSLDDLTTKLEGKSLAHYKQTLDNKRERERERRIQG
ncbi:MAG: hypothetical protein NY202_01070 [Mollicutes bacterium UO1]